MGFISDFFSPESLTNPVGLGTFGQGITGITDAFGLTNTGAQAAALKAAKDAQLTPFNFFGPGGQYGGFGTYMGQPQTPAPVAPGGPYQPPSGFGPPEQWQGTGSDGSVYPAVYPPAGNGSDGTPGYQPGVRPNPVPGKGRGRYSAPVPTPAAPAGPPANYSFGNFTSDQRPGQDIGVNLGTLEPLREGFQNFAGQRLNQAFTPQQVNGYQGGLDANAQASYGALAQAFGGLQGQPGSDQYRQQTLDLLRQEAAPFEQRAYNANNQNLFNTGRLGTTGGGIQTEAFARGLGQADLQRQLQAGQESRNASTQQNSLLDSAFGRFANTSQLASDLNTSQYQRAVSQAQLPGQLQGQDLQLALQGLSGQGQLYDQGMSGFQAALNAAIARSNSASGVASNLISASSQGGPLASLFGGLASGGGAAMAGGGGGAGLMAMFSDVKLKSNLVQIGYRYGLPLYRWTWNDKAKKIGADKQPTEGVLAQHVLLACPEAVTAENGFLKIDPLLLEATYGV